MRNLLARYRAYRSARLWAECHRMHRLQAEANRATNEAIHQAFNRLGPPPSARGHYWS